MSRTLDGRTFVKVAPYRQNRAPDADRSQDPPIKESLLVYQVALGSTIPILHEEVNKLLTEGYSLAGDLVVVGFQDEQGEYAMFYQPMIKYVAET